MENKFKVPEWIKNNVMNGWKIIEGDFRNAKSGYLLSVDLDNIALSEKENIENKKYENEREKNEKLQQEIENFFDMLKKIEKENNDYENLKEGLRLNSKELSYIIQEIKKELLSVKRILNRVISKLGGDCSVYVVTDAGEIITQLQEIEDLGDAKVFEIPMIEGILYKFVEGTNDNPKTYYEKIYHGGIDTINLNSIVKKLTREQFKKLENEFDNYQNYKIEYDDFLNIVRMEVQGITNNEIDDIIGYFIKPYLDREY